jgi:hypothetical protein
MVALVQEMPEVLRPYVQARAQVRRMFDEYSTRFVATWQPAPMPAGWNEPPARREVGR